MNISCEKVKLADDSTIWSVGKDTYELYETIQQELQAILELTKSWSLKKSEICLFSKGNLNTDITPPKVQLDGKSITYNPNLKILGLHVDESLSF